MRLLTLFCASFLLCTIHLFAQVPTPQSTNSSSFSGASWAKTSTANYELFDANGNRLTNVKDLLYLETQTLPVLDKDSRSIYLLKDFKNASVGTFGSATILAKNIGKNFYLTNQNSFGNFINEEHVKGPFSNIGGSYIYYIEAEETTYYLKDIRNFNDWGAKTSQKLEYSATNTYWYRDVENGEFGVIKKGKTLDYDRTTNEKDGNDIIVKWDGVKTYVLEGYYTSASFIYKPVKKYGSSSSSNNSSGVCVKGDCQNGWGKFEYDDGYYDGFWKNGKKDGYGLYKWTDIGKYIGSWENNTMKGYGVYIANNEDNIIGEYSSGQLNGRGITITGDDWEQGVFSGGNLVSSYEFYSNDIETGCVSGDCENKYGRFKWDNGDSFTGFFKNGSLLLGTYTFSNGGKYSGMFNSENQFHGMGRYFFGDDAYYGGEWRNGKYHGRGYYHNEDLVQQIGEWSNGTLIRSMK